MERDDITELDVPDGVREANQAIEVLRAWIADGALHVTFDPETFQNGVPEWGRLLADVAHHVAHAVALNGQMDRGAALDLIHAAFDRHTGPSPDKMSGSMKSRTEH